MDASNLVAEQRMELAVNHAIADARLAIARQRAANPMAGLSIDSKRPNAWCEYGFPETITFEAMKRLYARGGLAYGVVNKLAGHCWKTYPWIIEGDKQDRAKEETPWERHVKKDLIRDGRFWNVFAEADVRRLVGRYSGILLQIRDSGKWSDPVTSANRELVKAIPAWAGELVPESYYTDETDARYGEVKQWSYKEESVGGIAGRELKIHSDRVIILGDYRSNAIGFLEPIFNNFISIEKVEGGSGESFLKNASRQMNLNFDKEVDLNNMASMYNVPIKDLKAKFNDAARDLNAANDLLLITQGASVNPLTSQVSDPTPTYDINLRTISSGSDIPSKVITGMQTGERASTEDQRYMDDRCQRRRGIQLTFDIQDAINHLIRIKVIKSVSEFTVMWDELGEDSTKEKLDNASKMADVNKKAYDAGAVRPVFTEDEMREASGYDKQEELPPMPDDDDDDDDDDQIIPEGGA